VRDEVVPLPVKYCTVTGLTPGAVSLLVGA